MVRVKLVNIVIFEFNRPLEEIISNSKYVENTKHPTLQRGGEGASVVTFSLHSLTTTASWERGET